MKLHYSQTLPDNWDYTVGFYIPMKLHYSQTSIWQYTHYKRVVISYNNQSKKKLSSAFRPRPVCHALPTCDSNIFFYILFDLLYPVEFTCLSNKLLRHFIINRLLYPVEFTYLSNLLSSSHFLSIHLYFIEFNCLSNLTEKVVLIVWLLCYAEFLIF